jgi:hypothetical protein
LKADSHVLRLVKTQTGFTILDVKKPLMTKVMSAIFGADVGATDAQPTRRH